MPFVRITDSTLPRLVRNQRVRTTRGATVCARIGIGASLFGSLFRTMAAG